MPITMPQSVIFNDIITNEEKLFNSYVDCAKYIQKIYLNNISSNTITNRISDYINKKQKGLYKKRFSFKKVNI